MMLFLKPVVPMLLKTACILGLVMNEQRDQAAFCCCWLEKALITGDCPAMNVAELFTAGGRQAGKVAGVTFEPLP